MSNNNRSGGFAGKGYYIALILCAAAIGITGYLYARNQKPEEEPVSLMETTQALAPQQEARQDVPVLATQPEPVPPRQTTPQGTKPTAPTAPAAAPKPILKTMSPVTGDAIWGYSVEALSYNQTTRDWRTHSGVDLAAQEGDPVAAAADGEVYTTYRDDSLGYTVVLRHQGGYTTKYSSLSEELQVQPGDTVTMGQTIGYASDSAITESSLGAHVHFSVSCQGEDMDPAEFLALGS